MKGMMREALSRNNQRYLMKWVTPILVLIPTFGSAQSQQERVVDSLRFVTEVPYACEATGELFENDSLIYNIGCGDRFFWEAVKGKREIIPFLIEKLADTTQTTASVPYYGGQYAVADVAYTALQEIVDGVPTFELLGMEFDAHGCGYCSYWIYLRNDIQNRNRFKAAVRSWYDENRTKLIWVKSNKVLTFDLSAFSHPNRGHFEVKQQ
jgi:hypothetical protein